MTTEVPQGGSNKKPVYCSSCGNYFDPVIYQRCPKCFKAPKLKPMERIPQGPGTMSVNNVQIVKQNLTFVGGQPHTLRVTYEVMDGPNIGKRYVQSIQASQWLSAR